ncbi:MAG: hypothetical protein E7157_03880 [Lactobacillales bacterium]|nr:hypothetical protein [Lactobacillales bacterium]
MKKLFQIIGFISLMGFSFFYTEKTISVVKEYDDIMINIRSIEKEYKKEPIQAIITGNKIIPGISGSKIDINRSYSKMKRYGKFEKSLIVLKKIEPNNLLEKNKHKYIVSGNKNKKMISLIFLVDKNDSIDEIINILDKKEIKGNFFVDLKWLEKNNNLIPILVRENHIVGNLSHNMDYLDSSFIWMETIIEKIGNQSIGYCYSEKENKDIISICKKNNNYTIMPNIIIEDNPYTNVKEKLVSGGIISFKINDNLIEELPIIINFIKSKGYKVENLNIHLEE